MLTLWHLCFFSEESLNVCLGMRQTWRRRLHTWSFHTTTEVERYMRCLPKFEFQRSSESFLVYYLHSVLGAFSSACNTGDPGLIPGSGRSTGEGKGYPLQYSGLENSIYCDSDKNLEKFLTFRTKECLKYFFTLSYTYQFD